jgi:hypothetical protein
MHSRPTSLWLVLLLVSNSHVSSVFHVALSKTRLIKILHHIFICPNQTTYPVVTSCIRSRETFKSWTFSICNIFSKNHRVIKPADGTYSVRILIIYFSKTHFKITQPFYCSVSLTASTLEEFTPLASQHHPSKNCRQKTKWCYKLRTFHHFPVPSDIILRVLFSNTLSSVLSPDRQTVINVITI